MAAKKGKQDTFHNSPFTINVLLQTGRMKKLGMMLLVALLLAGTGQAQDYKMALGIRLSSDDAIVNNSISFKYFTGRDIALEALLSFSEPGAFGLLVEKHKPTIAGGLTWFYGGGAYIGFTNETLLGLQGVLGLDYKIPEVPLNLSLDWKPELNLVERVSFEPAAIGVSIRFTFR